MSAFAYSYAKWSGFEDPDGQTSTNASPNVESVPSFETPHPVTLSSNASHISSPTGFHSETIQPVRVGTVWLRTYQHRPCHTYIMVEQEDIEKIGDIAESRIMEYVRRCRQHTREVCSQNQTQLAHLISPHRIAPDTID